MDHWLSVGCSNSSRSNSNINSSNSNSSGTLNISGKIDRYINDLLSLSLSLSHWLTLSFYLIQIDPIGHTICILEFYSFRFFKQRENVILKNHMIIYIYKKKSFYYYNWLIIDLWFIIEVHYHYSLKLLTRKKHCFVIFVVILY